MAENYFGLSDQGRQRDNNEDAFIAETLSTGWLLACVIDGVGGYEGGEVAAEIARSTLLQSLRTANADALQGLRNAFLEANRAIYNEKAAGRGNSQMACVLTAALVDAQNNQFFYAHVGDTRMYLLRDGSLVKVTKDQSFVGFLEDSGRLTEAEAMAHPKRNEINKALGFDAHIDLQDDYIETGSSPFLPGDTLLLCSDGLTDLVTAKEMASVLLGAASLPQKGKALIDAANNAGGKDNITVVLVQHTRKPQKQKATKPVLLKKEVPKIDNSPTSIATPAATPRLIEPSAPKPKKSNVALWAFMALSLLLALGCFWLWTKNKDLQAALPQPVVPSVPNAGEKRLSDSLGLAVHNFNFTDTLHKTVTVSDTLFIRQDTLHINGNGLVLQADSAFNGPAFFVTANCKQLIVENIRFKNFKTAVITETKGIRLSNVYFENNKVPLQKNFFFDNAVSGKINDSFIVRREIPR